MYVSYAWIICRFFLFQTFSKKLYIDCISEVKEKNYSHNSQLKSTWYLNSNPSTRLYISFLYFDSAFCINLKSYVLPIFRVHSQWNVWIWKFNSFHNIHSDAITPEWKEFFPAYIDSMFIWEGKDYDFQYIYLVA